MGTAKWDLTDEPTGVISNQYNISFADNTCTITELKFSKSFKRTISVGDIAVEVFYSTLDDKFDFISEIKLVRQQPAFDQIARSIENGNTLFNSEKGEK